jgi:triacylglycerol lipase
MMLKSKLIIGLVGLTLLGSSSAFAAVQTTPTNSKASYAKTKYPIVFNHGMFGFTRLGTADFGLDYFYRVLPDLAKNGATVYATQVSPLNSTEIRGEQLVRQVEEVLAITGAKKVNLIGHSHGGPTTRYAAGVMPSKIASVTTVAGVNKGSKVADLLLSTGLGAAVVSSFVEATLMPVMNWAQGKPNLPTNMNASLKSLSTQGALAFNKRFPNGVPTTECGQGASVSNGIYNYSWTGNKTVTNVLDPDTLVVGLAGLAFGFSPSDGLVGTCSAHFGKVIRNDYAHNHLDEVNQIMGLRGLFSPDPVEQFRQHANRLKLAGL